MLPKFDFLNFINNTSPLISSSVTLLGQKDEIVNLWDKRKRRKKFTLLPRQYESINYEQLINWLIAYEWEAANQETRRIILLLKKDIASATILGNVGIDYLFSKHSHHLLYLDELWMIASDNHFGFTPQLNTWKALGKVMNWRTYYQLTYSLGRSSSQRLQELKFSIDTPEGHLPALPFPYPSHCVDRFFKVLSSVNPALLYFLEEFNKVKN